MNMKKRFMKPIAAVLIAGAFLVGPASLAGAQPPGGAIACQAVPDYSGNGIFDCLPYPPSPKPGGGLLLVILEGILSSLGLKAPPAPAEASALTSPDVSPGWDLGELLGDLIWSRDDSHDGRWKLPDPIRQ